MSEPGLLWLRDPRLAPLAISPLPAWAWSLDATRILWANPTGAAMLHQAPPALAAQIAAIATALPADGRLERLRGLGAGVGRALTCNCLRILLRDGTPAILVAAAERAGPDLSLSECVHRLLADADAPVAVFATDGALMDATHTVRAWLGGARTLAEIGAEQLATEARASGHAAGLTVAGLLAVDRIGVEPATVLFVSFGALPAKAASPPTARSRPLRFVWRIDSSGSFTLDSPEFTALAGPPTATALGRNWEEFATTLGLDPEGQVRRALATRDTWSGVTVDWPVAGPHGGERVAVELAGLPMFDRERNFGGYRGFGVCRDHARLKILAQQRAAMPSASPATACGAATGEPPAELPPENVVMLRARRLEPAMPSARDAFQEPRLTDQHLTGDEIGGGRALTALAVAARVAIEPTVEPTIEPPVATTGAATEATVGARAELAAARDEIVKLNAILDTATDGVVVFESDLRIASANRSAQALFGHDADAFMGRTFLDLFAPESVDTARGYIDALDGSVLNAGREVIGRERQGGLIPLFMLIGRLDSGRFCAVFRDLTQWKKAEAELIEAKRRAEKQSAAKSEFLAKVSHEIRNPLNAIVGFSEIMMEERFGAIGNNRYQQYLKDIHTSGGHIMSLVDDLLDLSKIEAGKLELNLTGVGLNELVQQCVALMQPQANRERVIIRSSLARRLPQVTADARSLRQIVLNLLSNAVKFNDAGGQVIVSTAHAGGNVVLRVRDTGIGMSEQELAIALEPYRQVATSSRAGGLGLPLTKALAEANGARFRIDSKPHAGTLVEVTFSGDRGTGA